jgi:hypothetical protein
VAHEMPGEDEERSSREDEEDEEIR